MSKVGRWARRIAAGNLFLCAWFAGAAPAAADALPPERADAIDQLLNGFAGIGMFNGVVMIDRGGQIVFSRAYGLADYERSTPLTPDTVFRIASVSKNMTDAALAAMIARGQLSLATKVSEFLPSFPQGDRITIELLVTHRSGIPHTNDTEWGDGSKPIATDEIVARLAAMKLDFEPGTKQRYSNGGYAVLAKIMELAAKKPYPQLMQELVFAPLKLQRTGAFVDSRVAVPGMAVGYEPGPRVGSRRHSRPYYPESRPGGGSLYGSAADVMRFAQAAYRGQMEGAQRTPLLFGAGHTAAVLGDAKDEREMSGRAPGFYINVYASRKDDLIVVSIANNYATVSDWAKNIALLALGQEPLLAKLPALDIARTVKADDPHLGVWMLQMGPRQVPAAIGRGDDGHLFFFDETGKPGNALVPLANGGYIETLYFGLCRMRADNRDVIDCGSLFKGGLSAEMHRRK